MPEIKLVAEVDLASFKKAEKETSDLSDRIADAWSRAWEQVGATATETFLDSFKALDKSAQEALTATKKTASDTLGGAFSEAISGDLQKAGDVLEAFIPPPLAIHPPKRGHGHRRGRPALPVPHAGAVCPVQAC